MKHATELIEEVFRDYEDVALKFVGPKYWNTLKFTYIRTLDDILAAAEELRRERGDGAPLAVLEIGAFAGIVSTALKRAGFSVTAADISLFMMDDALLRHYRKEGITPVCCDLSRLPLPIGDGAFDIVICCEVLEHLNFNVIPVFREMNRLLKQGGFLYLATPNQANIATRLRLARGLSIHNPVEHLVWQLDPHSDFSIGLHWREYMAEELGQLLTLTNFKMVRHYYCHYNDRSQSRFLRRRLVSLMYKCFPAFLPCQVAIGAKHAECNQGVPSK
jgi:2-polyprenyl-3-methyl-5-hydroxy-6-metoxy-1,4-benzoquinol methylase